ncbi:hypothetical protein [Erwinia mallotivora]|uniref:hypothetical protein n=1 Tax=Erwinia mallotivora TaxID=69222 RepID=UPI0021C07355|nr:hypothetical protein [Erwinia mallotivora]
MNTEVWQYVNALALTLGLTLSTLLFLRDVQRIRQSVTALRVLSLLVSTTFAVFLVSVAAEAHLLSLTASFAAFGISLRAAYYAWLAGRYVTMRRKLAQHEPLTPCEKRLMQRDMQCKFSLNIFKNKDSVTGRGFRGGNAFHLPVKMNHTMTFEDAKATLIANVATPNDYDRLTTWQALRNAAHAELLQATYHLNQLADVASLASEKADDALQTRCR